MQALQTRRIRIDGNDSDYMYFSTKSWSRPGSDIRHELTIDKRTGQIKCTCENATYRPERRTADLLDPTTGQVTACKHIQCLLRRVFPPESTQGEK